MNLVIADRLAPPFRPAGPDEEFLERYHDVVDPRIGWVRAGVAIVLALIAGRGRVERVELVAAVHPRR